MDTQRGQVSPCQEYYKNSFHFRSSSEAPLTSSKAVDAVRGLLRDAAGVVIDTLVSAVFCSVRT